MATQGGDTAHATDSGLLRAGAARELRRWLGAIHLIEVIERGRDLRYLRTFFSDIARMYGVRDDTPFGIRIARCDAQRCFHDLSTRYFLPNPLLTLFNRPILPTMACFLVSWGGGARFRRRQACQSYPDASAYDSGRWRKGRNPLSSPAIRTRGVAKCPASISSPRPTSRKSASHPGRGARISTPFDSRARRPRSAQRSRDHDPPDDTLKLKQMQELVKGYFVRRKLDPVRARLAEGGSGDRQHGAPESPRQTEHGEAAKQQRR